MLFFRDGLHGLPLFQEVQKNVLVVTLAFFQFARALRMQKRAIAVQHKEVRIGGHPGKLLQERLVAIVTAVIDFHDHETGLQQFCDRLVGLNELVQKFAPASPVSPDFQENPFLAG